MQKMAIRRVETKGKSVIPEITMKELYYFQSSKVKNNGKSYLLSKNIKRR